MTTLGLGEIAVRRKAPLNDAFVTHLPTYGGWWGAIKESFAGAWQRGLVENRETILSYSTVWACITLIADDISKLWVKLVEEDEQGICTKVSNPAYSPVLRKPNHFQTWVKFVQYWFISLLTHGNTYVLKERDGRGVVVALYVLEPSRVQVLVAPDGSVFYQLSTDFLSGLREASLTVPAREIIHDVCVPLYHPLVGVSPIYACGMAASHGLKILGNSMKLFSNGSQPGGILTAPGPLSAEAAKKLRENWEQNYTGEQNVGKLVVLGSGLKYEPMAMTAVDAEVVAQLKLTDERICATFHVPGFMVGVGAPPPYTDIQSINLQYYTQALQHRIENFETLMCEGLELKAGYGVELDLDALSRMDKKTQMALLKDGVGGPLITIDEGRAELDRKPVAGGDVIWQQSQNWPLSDLALRQMPTGPAPVPPLPAPGTPAPPAVADTAKEAELDMGAFGLRLMLKAASHAETIREYADAA